MKQRTILLAIILGLIDVASSQPETVSEIETISPPEMDVVTTTVEPPSMETAERAERTTNKRHQDVPLLAGALVFFIIFVIVAIILCVKLLRIGNLNKVLLRMSSQSEAMDAKQLQKKSSTINSNQKALMDESKKIGTKQDDDYIASSGSCGNSRVQVLEKCRNPKIKHFKQNGVTIENVGRKCKLHMNFLYDLFGNEIYLCQAPRSHEIIFMWFAIVEKQVGVVVWLNRMEAECGLEPYVKNFESKTWVEHIELETVFTEFGEDVDIFQTHLKLRPDESKERMQLLNFEERDVFFLVLHGWTAKDNVSSKILAECVSTVQYYQEYQYEHFQPHKILVHNVDGVGFTAEFVACYLARQMIFYTTKVDVVGICQYIREYRFSAFTSENNASRHVKNIYAVASTFASSLTNEEGTLLLTKKEIVASIAPLGDTADREAGDKSNKSRHVKKAHDGRTMKKTSGKNMQKSISSKRGKTQPSSKIQMSKAVPKIQTSKAPPTKRGKNAPSKIKRP